MNKPKLHLTSERNWMNDPNGLIYYKGKYHAFYQHFPYATQWGTMHWGHAVSDDMVNWTYEPIALFPSKPYDKNGCFSGSAIEVDGDLYLYYTSVKYIETEEEVSIRDISKQILKLPTLSYPEATLTLLEISLISPPIII